MLPLNPAQVCEAIHAIDIRRVLAAASEHNTPGSALLANAHAAGSYIAEHAGYFEWDTLTVAAMLGYAWVRKGGAIEGHDAEYEHRILNIYNSTATANELSPDQIAEFSRLFKGYLPATGLMLHLANPDRFSFFDEQVCAFVTNGREVAEEVFYDLEVYQTFQVKLRALANSIQAAQLVRAIRKVEPIAARLSGLNISMYLGGEALRDKS